MKIETGQFTLAEYIKVKERLIDGKAPWPDGIAPEILKYYNLNKIIWGNLEEVGNNRGIALSVIAAKMTNKMTLNQVQPYIDPILRPNQNGFISGRSTT